MIKKTKEKESIRGVKIVVFYKVQKLIVFVALPNQNWPETLFLGGVRSAEWRGPPEAPCKGTLHDPNIDARLACRLKGILDDF